MRSWPAAGRGWTSRRWPRPWRGSDASPPPSAPRSSSPAADLNPGNFLAAGGRLTGFVDFAMARFEDPHYGLAKYPVYDLHPYAKAGIIGRYRRRHGVSPDAFAHRLAVRCVWTLQREIPVLGHDAALGAYRDGTLRLLRGARALLAA